jgi:predicted TIM-barrel fold metal-dependent hydrolase
MIIDCHTHCYPEEVASQPRQWAEARGELHWADLVAPVGRKSIQDWAGPEEFLAAMDAAGVDRAVLLGWYWEHASTCRWHNEVIAEWVRQAPKRFIGFASILPNEHVIDQLESANALGLRGVGELHPGVQGFDSENAHWQALADWCASHHWPVNCHASSEKGNDHPAAVATPLNDYLKMAQDRPELKLILAHWGGGLPLDTEEALPENLYFDCAASPLLYRQAPFREMIDRAGLRQVLFGSDYPLRIYPRKQRNAEMTTFLNAIRTETELTETERNALLGQNFEQILAAGGAAPH